MLGFLMLNSPTLFDALSNIQRYFRVLGEGEDIEIVRTGPHFTLRFRETDKALRGLRHNSEYIAAIIVRACRDMTRKRISPVRAEFMHGRPNAKVAYADYLGCSVKFHADWDALVYDTDTMQLPVIGADSALLKVLERACRKFWVRLRRSRTSFTMCGSWSSKGSPKGPSISTGYAPIDQYEQQDARASSCRTGDHI